jgi:hypothetical protein
MRKVILGLLMAFALATVASPSYGKSIYMLLKECCDSGDDLCCAGKAFLDWM